ncbi:MAG TPA: M20/M25/M40 family metallo-hydrolase, partial [Puia sp.]
MHKRSAIICLLAAILIAWLCIHFDTTPARVDPNPADTAFSEPRAMAHLREIAKTPHSIGTPANADVRAYIANACAQLGLDTSIQRATTANRVGNGVVASTVYNIIARLKGANRCKTLLIAAHYDSQPNALGAGDDGSGCAAMLETARALKAGAPLNNDVLFLFTDGEESGLFGAEAFVRDNPQLKEVGMMLNFDARCNAGSSLIAETNPGNGWVIDGYARSRSHHNASSLNYEIYKLLPNSTDYTPFKNAGIPGLNSAVIDGFVHYHSMTDGAGAIDPNSLQEEGDNMLAGARYFGNIDIRGTKTSDETYFNIIGGWFVHYPAALNIYFLVLTNILLVLGLVIGFSAKQVRFRGLLAGFLAFPPTMVILYFLGSWTLRGIRSATPLYLGYYSNTYHPYYFYLALAALAIAVFT